MNAGSDGGHDPGVSLSVQALENREEDVPADLGHPISNGVVDSEGPKCPPNDTFSPAQAPELENPTPLVAHPIVTSPGAMQLASETGRNVQPFEELPSGTSAALNDRPTAGELPPGSLNPVFASGSHAAPLGDLPDGDHAAHPPDEPHHRASDLREDVPPVGPCGRTTIEQTSDVLANGCPAVDSVDDGREHSAASGRTNEDGGRGAGDGEDVGERDTAADHRPAEDYGHAEQSVGHVVEEQEHEGESACMPHPLSRGMDMDTAGY